MGHPVFNADAGAADARTYTHRQPQIGERKRLLFPQRLSNLFRCLFHNSTVYGSKRFVPFSEGKDNRNFSFVRSFLIGFSYAFGGKYQRSTYFVLNALFSTANPRSTARNCSKCPQRFFHPCAAYLRGLPQTFEGLDHTEKYPKLSTKIFSPLCGVPQRPSADLRRPRSYRKVPENGPKCSK